MTKIRVTFDYMKDEIYLSNKETKEVKICNQKDYKLLAEKLNLLSIYEDIEVHVKENSSLFGKIFKKIALHHHFLSYLNFQLPKTKKANLNFEDDNNYFFNNNPELNNNLNETLTHMEQNCSNMLELTNKLPNSEQKEHLIKALTKQHEVINNSLKRKL